MDLRALHYFVVVAEELNITHPEIVKEIHTTVVATVDDEEKNLRMYRLINANGYDNEAFEIPGQSRFIAGEPVAYEKMNPQDASSDDYYGMFYWNYQGSDENSQASGNAFVCEWDY